MCLEERLRSEYFGCRGGNRTHEVRLMRPDGRPLLPTIIMEGHFRPENSLVLGVGVEPTFPDSKSSVLPLDDPSVNKVALPVGLEPTYIPLRRRMPVQLDYGREK